MVLCRQRGQHPSHSRRPFRRRHDCHDTQVMIVMLRNVENTPNTQRTQTQPLTSLMAPAQCRSSDSPAARRSTRASSHRRWRACRCLGTCRIVQGPGWVGIVGYTENKENKKYFGTKTWGSVFLCVNNIQQVFSQHELPLSMQPSTSNHFRDMLLSNHPFIFSKFWGLNLPI